MKIHASARRCAEKVYDNVASCITLRTCAIDKFVNQSKRLRALQLTGQKVVVDMRI